MYRDQNKATCRRFIQQIFDQGEVSSIRDFVSADFIHHQLDDVSVPSGRSPEWFAEMVGLYRLTFPDLQVEVQDQIAESDRVVNCLRMRGTQEDPLLGLGGSGRTVDITGIRVDRLAEGKIAESWVHWDSLGMLQQMGALPDLARTPPPAPWEEKTASLPTLMPFPPASTHTETRPSAAKWQPAAA